MPMIKNRKLRLGILSSRTNLSTYHAQFLQWCLSHPRIELSHFIVMKERTIDRKRSDNHIKDIHPAAAKRSAPALKAAKTVRALGWIEEAMLRGWTRHKNYVSDFDVSKTVPFTISATTSFSPADFSHSFDPEDVRTIKDLDLDLLLMLTGRNLSGEILSTARLGIVSVQYSDAPDCCASPPGFWDVYFQRETTSFSFSLIKEGMSRRVPLKQGRFSTKYFWKYNEANLFERSMYHLKRFIEDIAEKDSLPAVLTRFPYTESPSLQSPTLLQSLCYIWSVASSILQKATTKLLRRIGWDFRWRVAYVPTNWTDAVLWRGIEIKNPPLHFLADPFVLKREGKHYCFVEDFSYKAGKADISVYELAPDGATRLGTAVSEPFHLSFPFLFTYNDELYMCPESAGNKDVRIYRCIEFPLKWRLEKVILADVFAADTMLFEQDGRWWMLTNIDPFGTGDHGSELSIFYADSPLSSDWTPHDRNPVLIDASRARNAGLIREGGRLYRVSQCQGYNFYGQRSSVNEVIKLTTSAYVEERALIIRPDFKRNAKGTHHLHSNGSMTAFDYIMYDNFRL